MANAAPTEIRLYCVCGQKMKISADMFGRKCKCIACRQKLRVPYADEIPNGATEIRLKEHPEFLRKPYLGAKAASGKAKEKKDGFESIIIPGDFIKPVMDSEEGEESESGLAEQEPTERLIPLEDYAPLQALCSLEYKAEKLRSESSSDNASLQDLEARLSNVRAKMELKFRERVAFLNETLRIIREELALHHVDLRADKLTYPEYRSKVRSLRHRREACSRLQHNLRAWLQVRDPYSAGGYIDLPNEAIPSAFPLPHPEEAPIPSDIALNVLLEDLHCAFKERVEADQTLENCQRQCDKGELNGAALDHARATAMAAKARARARILYARARIMECEKDFEHDADALQAKLLFAEEVKRNGGHSERAHKTIKAELLRAQNDNAQARDLARRALSSNSANDVPAGRGTFFKRLVNTTYVKDLGTDRWLGLCTAALLLITSFLPLTPVTNNWAILPEYCAALIIAAMLVAAVSLVSNKNARTYLYTGLWVILCVGGSFYLHELRFTANALGDLVREDTQWWLRPGMISLVLCVALLGATTCLAATTSRRKIPLLPIFGVLLIGMGVALTVTHLGGLRVPALQLDAAQIEAANPMNTLYRVTLPVENTGLRPVWLVRDSAMLPFPVSYTLTRSAKADARPMPLAPDSVQRDGGVWIPPDEVLVLNPGENILFRFLLEPGNYEFTLESDRIAGMPIQSKFTLEGATSVEVTSPSFSANNKPSGDNAASASSGDYLMVELQGVLNNDEGEPVFSLNVAWPDGAQERWRIQLNQVVFGPWRAQEYNPAENSITFSNGEVLRILKKNETLKLTLN